MIDIICGYTDPLLGDVYCDEAIDATTLALATGGEAWVEFWHDGIKGPRSGLVHLETMPDDGSHFSNGKGIVE
jgi:hypothetical protein